MTPFQAMRMRKPAAAGGSDPYFSSTVLLLGGEGANNSTTFTDESAAARGNATVLSGAKVSTAQFKHGAAAILLNGSSDYLTYPDSTDWEFGAGQYTVECFVYFTSVADVSFCGHRDNSANGWRFGRFSGAIQLSADNSAGTIGVSWTPTINTWYHVCADRDAAGVTRVYVDGTMLQKATGTNAMTAHSNTFAVGRNPASAVFFFPGYIDEMRITKGAARYASDSGYTVPTAAFPRS